MPNWCSTTINISHPDRQKLEELYALIEKWTSKNYMPNGFGLEWLGNVVGNSGVGTFDKRVNCNIRCRGYIAAKELTPDSIIIYAETAWCPMLEMWLALLDRYLPDAELTFISEEPGCELYVTNDYDVVGKYYVDNPEGDIDIEGICTGEDVVKELQKLLDSAEPDADKLIEMLEDSDEEYELYIHKYEYANAEDFD